MRLGGPVFAKYNGADGWAKAVKAAGYSAAYSPSMPGVEKKVVEAYRDAAKASGIIIAEVGAWSNPLSPDKAEAKKALDNCKACLKLADELGARCCVNIAGSRGKKWDGPSPLDLTKETFEMIVFMVRDIIDTVKPTKSFYRLETMPWMYPDSPDSYLELVKAIDREGFAVHFDPVNMISSPQRYFATGPFIKECIEKLGKKIRSCHAKDIILGQELTTHLSECLPGTGGLDYKVYLSEVSKLGKDVTVMLEHLPNEAEYVRAAAFIQKTAKEVGVTL